MGRTPTPERWREIERVLDAALDVPWGERAAYLDTACGADAELRAEVERLLRAHDRAGDFLGDPLPSVAPALLAAAGSSDSGPATGAGAVVAGRYLLERELGRGGTATVYLARDVKHRRPVAVKILDPSLARAVGPTRFLREIEITANLQHPHILPLHDSGEFEGLVYYVMPYVAGESLRDRLRRDGRLPVDEAVRLARDVASALDYAHRRGIVHRDIKPANILIEDGQAIVADFGIARAVSEAAAAGEPLTRAGVTLGTPAYMSPEQATGGYDLGPPSDVYSLGCVLYEMLAGAPPFTGPTAHAIIAQHLSEPPPPLRAARPEAPGPIEQAVARALSKDPAHRFRSAAEFTAALEGGVTSNGRDRDAERGLRSRVNRLVRRHPRRAGVAAVAVLALAAATASVVRSPASRVVPGASTIAVTSFVPAENDSALARLGRDLAVTLSANLDGVGDVRAVDPLTVLAQRRPGGAPWSSADIAALARRVGAGSVLHGTLIRIGDRVRVDASLVGSDGASQLARASATAATADIPALTDSLTLAILRQVWRTRTPPTPSLAAITTRSIPALRAYLEGERLIAAGSMRPAAEAFARAVAADSTFWFAYWRYAWARSYNAEPVDSAVTAVYAAHRFDFPERDRLLIEARLAGSLSARVALDRALTERYPDYWPGWFDLGEMLVHRAPYLGTSLMDAREPLERVVLLNPDLAVGWQHLHWLALSELDTVASSRALEQLARLRFDSVTLAESGLNGLRFARYLDRLARSGGVPDTILADSLGEGLVGYRGPVPPEAFETATSIVDAGSFHRAHIDLARHVVRLRGVPAAITVGMPRGAAMAWAARGAWDSALVTMDRFVAGAADPAAPLSAYRLAAVGAWLGAVDTAAATARRGPAPHVAAQLPPADRAELAWTDGLLAFARRDARALAVARAGLRRVDDPMAPMLDSAMAAFELELTGARARALELLLALERDRYQTLGDRHPFFTSVNRLLASRWVLARGDTAEAARLLNWLDAVLFPAQRTALANATLAGLAYLERARIEEALGRRDVAARYYWQFLRRYDAPVAANRHLVDEARAAISRLARP